MGTFIVTDDFSVQSTCPKCGGGKIVINEVRITGGRTSYADVECFDCGYREVYPPGGQPWLPPRE